MTRVLLRCPLVALLAVFAFHASSALAQAPSAPRYAIVDLGVISPANPGPLVVTNDGLVAEAVTVSNAMHAAISFQGLGAIDLTKNGGLGGPNSAAFGVNVWGMATGEAETAASNAEDFCAFGTNRVCRPFVWLRGVMSPLPLLKDVHGVEGRNAAAKGINVLGQVGGVAENNTPDDTCSSATQPQTDQQRPVLWANGKIRELPTSGLDAKGKAFDDPDGVVFRINDSGEAVGATGDCAAFTGFSYVGGAHATLWRNGSVVDLGSLGGVATPPPGSGLGNFGNFAYNVNRLGHVVGTAGLSDGTARAFLWTPSKHMQNVGTVPASGTVPADAYSIGLAISDLDEVGGASFPAGPIPADPNGLPRGFIQLRGGTPLDVNALVARNPASLYLITVCSINVRGELIGLALDAQFNEHGYLAVPTQ